MEGRLPKSNDEIIIGEGSIHVGDEIEKTLEGKLKKYKVVGIVNQAKPIENGNLEMSEFLREGIIAVTYLDESMLSYDAIVNVRILTKDISKICKTTNTLAEILNIYEMENIDKLGSYTENRVETSSDMSFIDSFQKMFEDDKTEVIDNISEQSKNEKIIYNEKILKYAGVTEIDATFKDILLIIGTSFILIITLSGITVIYTTFKITYTERIKEFGMLSSVGMSKKQRKSIILKEATMIRNNRNCNWISFWNYFFIYFTRNSANVNK